MTNIDNINNYKKTCLKRNNNDKYLIVNTIYGPMRMYDRLSDINIDYKEEILVPCTILFDNNRKYFDIVDRYRHILLDQNNKGRYHRFVVKRNNVEFEE